MNDTSADKNKRLYELGIPLELLVYPITGARYLESVGGPAISTYWNGQTRDPAQRQRDEIFVVACTTFWVSYLIGKTFDQDERCQSFDAAYLFQVKALVQFCRSIDLLSSARCYVDSFVLLRSLHSRIHLLLLFSLAPGLYSDWIKSPNLPKFRDARVRKELKRQGIVVFPHLYKQFSEIVHGEARALLKTGHIETGVFPYIAAINNMLFVAAKFLMGIAGWVGLSALLQYWNDTKAPIQKDEVERTEQLYQYIISHILVPQRFDHLWTMIAEDRHWEKTSDSSFVICEAFDFAEYRRRVALFHRPEQAARLSQEYLQSKE